MIPENGAEMTLAQLDRTITIFERVIAGPYNFSSIPSEADVDKGQIHLKTGKPLLKIEKFVDFVE